MTVISFKTKESVKTDLKIIAQEKSDEIGINLTLTDIINIALKTYIKDNK